MTQVWARSAPSPLVELRRPLGRPRSVTADLGPAFCAADGLRRFASALPALPDGRSRRRTRRRPHRATGAVWCIGMNYAAHAAESGSAPPRWPVLFLKTPNTVVGPYDDVPVPRGSGKTDWEVELGVVSVGPRAISPLRRRRAPASPVTSRPTTSPSVLSSWRCPAANRARASVVPASLRCGRGSSPRASRLRLPSPALLGERGASAGLLDAT